MDIIDILMARALNPNVQIDVAAATAKKAVADANAAKEAAADAVEDAQAAVEAAQNLTDIIAIQPEPPELTSSTKLWVDSNSEQVIQIPVMEDMANEIRKLELTSNITSENTFVSKDLEFSYDNTVLSELQNLVKYYSVTGKNTDGTMTQKAITEAIGSAGVNLGPENAGKIVVIGEDGGLIPGTIKESEIKHGGDDDTPTGEEVLGLFIDYDNRVFTRLADAADLHAGANFNKFSMYGGRVRCNVNDLGQITAFYGDSSYRDDGSNGQVMVYQPKFYYKREILSSKAATVGQSVLQENLYIADHEFDGCKIHPLFVNSDGTIAEYALIGAYEGCAYSNSVYDLTDSANGDTLNGLLSSIANAKPISGANKSFTIDVAEAMANRRGANWHITNLKAESALQMLFIIEYGMLNSQNSLEMGASQLPNSSGVNCSLITGSTANLGNTTGHAQTSTQTINGNSTTYSEVGKRAISYRGMENPWGNMWRMVGGVNISGNGSQGGGIPYICNNFNYSTTSIADNYISTGFSLPSTYGWIGYFGYANPDLDWVYLPSKCGDSANSALPVGDRLWTQANLRRITMVLVGGIWYWENQDGLFNYACDSEPTAVTHSKTARLMWIPNHSGKDDNVNMWEARG